MQRKLFHHAIDNSLFRGRIGEKALLQAAEESQKLRYDDMNRQVMIHANFTQSSALDDLIAISYREVRDIFADDDFTSPESLSIQFEQQMQFIGPDGE